MSGLFCIANLLEVGRKFFFLNPLQTKMKQRIPIVNVKTKVFL